AFIPSPFSRYSTRAASEEAPTHQHVTHMAEDKARDKASEAGAHENLRAYQRDYQKNTEILKAYREQNKDKLKRWHQEHKQRVVELLRQWNKKNPSRQYEYGRQLSLEKRELYLQKMAEYRLRCSNLGLLTGITLLRERSTTATNNTEWLVDCIHGSRSLKRLVNYPGPHINLYCMTRDNHITALVAVMAGEFSCHSCFTSDWSRALPIGHENMFVNDRPRHCSPEKAPDDNIEDKTETGPSDKPDPPT
ncbi:unnamed protein product, partial [Aureobasidium pullulans]